MGVVLPVKGGFDQKNVGLGIAGHKDTDLLIGDALTLDINSVLVFSEPHEEIFAVSICTLEVSTCNVDVILGWALDLPILGIDRNNLWSIEVLVRVVLTLRDNSLPILLIERELKDGL
jgi:hypothetical protein